MNKKIFCLTFCLLFICCTNAYCSCARAYIGIEGGGAWHLGLPRGSHGAGRNFNGHAKPERINLAGTIRLSLGYTFNRCLRGDISLSYVNARFFRWRTSFPVGNPTRLRSYLNSHIVLANVYGHLNPLMGWCSCFDPYFAIGIGWAHNELSSIKEFSTVTGNLVAKLKSGSHTNFAARFGIGVIHKVGSCLAFDLALFANYIGKISTGNRRKVATTGLFETIGPHSFTGNWLGTVTLGLKYFF